MLNWIFYANSYSLINQIIDNEIETEENLDKYISDILNQHEINGEINNDTLSKVIDFLINEFDKDFDASKMLFKNLIEPLMDSFTTKGRKAYLEIFSKIISDIRKYSKASRIDEYLDRFGLNTQKQIYERSKNLTMTYKSFNNEKIKKIKKIFILSRVTIGADVAVTSIIIERIMRLFPKAEIFFIGPKPQIQLFRGNSRLNFLELSFSKKTNIISKLESWADIVDIIENNTNKLNKEEYLIVDPDSRISQLGVMPLPVDMENYLFFNSSVKDIEQKNCKILNIAETTNKWLNEVFNIQSNFYYPKVWVKDVQFLDKLYSFPKLTDKPIVYVSFGVGGNDKKRLGVGFEKRLIFELINKDCTVILSKGIGHEEEIINKIINSITKKDIEVIEINCNSYNISSNKEKKLLVHKGSLAEFATLISKSDYYIGYDSLGQHLAAALEVPLTAIMAGFINEYFRYRWNPCGKGIINVIQVDKNQNHIDEELIISSIINNISMTFQNQTKRRPKI